MKKYLLLAIGLFAITMVMAIGPTTYATTGMGNCNDEPEGCIPQKDRVGADNDDPDNAGEDADRDGPGGDDGVGQETDDDEGEANCWGKVTSSLTQNEDDQPGIGEHSSDPVPNDGDNETPREGVGNQKEGHPSDHADTVGGLADDVPDCVD
jgi:hypothetical protein